MNIIKIDDFLSLPEATVTEVAHVLSDYFGVEASQSQCVGLIQSNKMLAADLYASGAGDTCTRERIIDVLVRKLLGPNRYWPINGDPQHVKDQFNIDFRSAALNAGYKVTQ